MAVDGNLLRGQCNRLCAACLAQSESRPDMDRNTALQIGQGEGRLAITAVRSPKQTEKRIVLVNGYDLAITEGPADRGKVPCNHPALTDIGTSHFLADD